MRKISKVKNLAGLLDLASIPQYQNGGETIVERTLPEVEVYGDQLRRDMQRTGLTYDELANLNYGAQRQSQIQQREEGVKELAYNAPVTGDVLSLYDVGKDIYEGNYGKAALGAGLFFVPNIVERPLRRIGNKVYRKSIDFVDPMPTHSDEDFEYFVRKLYAKQLPEYARPNTSVTESRKLSESRLKARGLDPKYPTDNEIKDVWNIGRSGFTKELYKYATDGKRGFRKFSDGFNALLYSPLIRLKLISSSTPYFQLNNAIFRNKLGYKINDYIDRIRGRERFTYNDADVDDILFHEYQHVLDNDVNLANIRLNTFPDITSHGWDPDQATKRYSKKNKEKLIKYFKQGDSTELAARGAQLKNYFGLSGDQKITPKMLRYARRFYLADGRMNNHMDVFFDGITDYDKFADWLNQVSYSEGGIHIKKKNKGKFTELKKRTGKSATWFKEHGTPAQKKMAVFALNSRKWKHK